VATHADELDRLGEDLMTKFLELASPEKVTVYLHICQCHMGDLVLKWGGLL
jgi:hypothetical protein